MFERSGVRSEESWGSVGTCASQTETSKLETSGSLVPLAVGGRPSHVSRESVSLDGVENMELAEVSGAGDDSCGVAEFGKTLTATLEAERYLRILEFRDSRESW